MDLTNFVLKHARHAHYTSLVATGVTVTGPSHDGLVQITFTRDLHAPIEEYFQRIETPLDGGGSEITLSASAPAKIEHLREDLVTVQVPLTLYGALAGALSKMSAALESVGVLADGAGTNGG